MTGSPGSLSAMHYFASSFSGRAQCSQILRRTFMEARWADCSVFPHNLILVDLLFHNVNTQMIIFQGFKSQNRTKGAR